MLCTARIFTYKRLKKILADCEVNFDIVENNCLGLPHIQAHWVAFHGTGCLFFGFHGTGCLFFGHFQEQN